jgi:hypothetical protein
MLNGDSSAETARDVLAEAGAAAERPQAEPGTPAFARGARAASTVLTNPAIAKVATAAPATPNRRKATNIATPLI